jgi:C-terminal processing protease CtpA/Prc
LDFTITRAKVEIEDVVWHLLPGRPVAHVALQEFGGRANDQLNAALIHEPIEAVPSSNWVEPLPYGNRTAP